MFFLRPFTVRESERISSKEEQSMESIIHPHSFLALTALITVGYQLVFFTITALFRFDKVTDFAGCSNIVVLGILTLTLKASWHLRQMALTSFVVVWGFRLGIFLLMRILQWGEDRRYDQIRNDLGKLAFSWTFQAAWVWTASLPLTIVNASDRNPPVQALDIIGCIMWLIGIIIEAIADQQKLMFKNSPASNEQWCNVGIWKYSRHPNYFGEILLWWGVFVASTPVLNGAEWLVVIGPVFLTLLMLFISGVPLLEESADKQHNGVTEYHVYKSTTSPLIPLPPAIYGRLPAWFKATFLFEFPLYTRKNLKDRSS